VSPQRLFNFSRALVRQEQAIAADAGAQMARPARSPEAIIEDLKQTLNLLLVIPAAERSEYFQGFQTFCLELERGTAPIPPEIKIKIDSLLWFCERMCRPDFVPADGQAFFLAWPHTLLDAIQARLQGEFSPPTN
jgi:hypothetical protein